MFKRKENCEKKFEIKFFKEHKKLMRIVSIVFICALLIATSVYGFLSVNVVSISDGTNVNKHYTLKK